MHRLNLQISARAGREYAPYVRRKLVSALELFNSSVFELSIVLVGDAEMSRLHRRFMAISGPTDVLTFPMELNSRGNVLSGEIVICVPEAVRNAKRLNSRIENELLLYAIHGLLHLSGFDDRTAAGYKRMHRKEDEILTQLGIGPVFSAPERKRKKRANGAH